MLSSSILKRVPSSQNLHLHPVVCCLLGPERNSLILGVESACPYKRYIFNFRLRPCSLNYPLCREPSTQNTQRFKLHMMHIGCKRGTSNNILKCLQVQNPSRNHTSCDHPGSILQSVNTSTVPHHQTHWLCGYFIFTPRHPFVCAPSVHLSTWISSEISYKPFPESHCGVQGLNSLPSYEPLSKLLVSPLITPIVVPYIINYITPSKEFRL